MIYNEIRRKTKKIKVGNTFVGGDSPVTVQSMTNTRTEDFEATYRQIKALEGVGCDIVRVTVPTKEAVESVYKLKCSDIKIPIVADIHFDYKLAIASAQAGIDKIRINPGNIGSPDRVKELTRVCSEKNIPIRIGVNSGSLEKTVLEKYGSPCAKALAESALYNIGMLEKFDFDNIIVAIKSSDVLRMVEANEIVASRTSYPIHLGVTEAGSELRGTVKSAMGIGSCLIRGIGDTLRVSLTADPLLEIQKGRAILEGLGMDEKSRISIVSCPTCGRTKIDMIGLVNSFESRLGEIKKEGAQLKVAIMGCIVNGPGEAKDADIGIAGGVSEGILFKKGEIICRIPEDQIIDRLIYEIGQMN